MPLALVHDWLNQLGGAEDVLRVLKQLFSQAPIFTSIYDRARMPASWQAWEIHSTWLDRLPGIHRYHQPYMPLFAWVWAHYRLPAEYDLILSNKSAFCIGVRSANPQARHVCYCLTPTRFTYTFEHYAQRERLPPGSRAILAALNAYLRRWETQAAQRVTRLIAISRAVQARIARFYRRDAAVIHPPVDMPPWSPEENADEGFYLIASRLLPYKRIDLAVLAFGQLRRPLFIAGEGRDRARLERLAAQHASGWVRFLGRVDEAELHRLLRTCRAFVFPGEEDFGIAPVRAMAYGKPVVAYAAGGALDTVVDGMSGVLFAEQTPAALAEAVQRADRVRFAPAEIRRHAEQFSTARFAEALMCELAALR
ncbi:MAG: glycosyltransferase [Anaerolineae bacterium]|nr:glycosyltransferase [Thermoflexales bacterium]MDW8054768.1 glycosyltransferase [Anaerolineae bacterium]